MRGFVAAALVAFAFKFCRLLLRSGIIAEAIPLVVMGDCHAEGHRLAMTGLIRLPKFYTILVHPIFDK